MQLPERTYLIGPCSILLKHWLYLSVVILYVIFGCDLSSII